MNLTFFVLMAHSGWRWIVLILLIFSIVKMLVGWIQKSQWTAFDSRLLQATGTALYFQIALGIVLYILLQTWTNMRFTGEHVIIALLSAGGVGFASARAKRLQDDTDKFKFASIGLIITFVLIYVALQSERIGGLFGSSSFGG